jgi:hypothetical protein
MKVGMFKSIKIVLVAVMLLTLASFAQNNGKKKESLVLHTFSLALPMDWSGTWEQYSNFMYEDEFTRDRDLKMDMTMGLQLKWARNLIFQSGWSFEVGAGIGFIDFPVNDYKIDSRFDLNAKVGLGFAPIVNDFILAVHAILGADLKYLGESYQEFEFTQEYSTLLFNFVGGVDVVLDYRITDRLGINAGVDVTMNLFGFGKRKISYGFADEERETIDYKLEHVFSGFQVVPRVGVSLKF